MKLLLSWLQDYVEFDDSAEALADRLTFSGSEVEAIDEIDGEVVLTIEVTPNRPDCLSIIGIAREVSALVRSPLCIPEVRLAETGPAVESLTSAELQDPERCARYSARVLQNATVAPAPDWMQRRLELCGVRSINNLVDITNYVLLECGQPLHAFDQSLLTEGRIVVRRAQPGESIQTLDGVERKLSDDMLVIADASNPVALAGIMGGSTSEIQQSTTDILLESAYFDPSGIRRTARVLGLSTESSYRFERGVDVARVDWASRRAAALMIEHAGARLSAGAIDQWPARPAARRIVWRPNRVRALMGLEVGDEEIREILTSLELPVEGGDDGACTVEVPTFRVDLEIEADVIEEVARIYGLDRIPAPTPSSTLIEAADDEGTRARAELRSQLVGLGLTEVMNYSFLSGGALDRFGTGDRDARVVLPNPISQDQAVMRNSLTPQMVETLGRNRARQTESAALFECGRVFYKGSDGSPNEQDRLAVGMMGRIGRGCLDVARPVESDEMFLWMKGLVEGLCRAMHVRDVQVRDTAHPAFEEGFAVDVMIEGACCGQFGILSRGIGEGWRMSDPVAILEMAIKPLLTHVFELPKLNPVPIYPSVLRDMAIIVDSSVRHEDVLRVIRDAAPAELTDVRLFDIYTGQGVGECKKSIAYSLAYQSLETTLTDEAVNAFHAALMDAVVNALNAEIRGTD
jgi:phenylalanyl-tRNA synthetase beta chain